METCRFQARILLKAKTGINDFEADVGGEKANKQPKLTVPRGARTRLNETERHDRSRDQN